MDEFKVKQTNLVNIANNGGLKMSLKAYRQYVSTKGAETADTLKTTPEQTFFIAYASNFCEDYAQNEAPFRFRVTGPLLNNEDFVNAFECAAGTPMNRANKCVLW